MTDRSRNYFAGELQAIFGINFCLTVIYSTSRSLLPKPVRSPVWRNLFVGSLYKYLNRRRFPKNGLHYFLSSAVFREAVSFIIKIRVLQLTSLPSTDAVPYCRRWLFFSNPQNMNNFDTKRTCNSFMTQRWAYTFYFVLFLEELARAVRSNKLHLSVWKNGNKQESVNYLLRSFLPF